MKSWIAIAPENPYFRWVFDLVLATGQWVKEVHMLDQQGRWEVRSRIEGEAARAAAAACGLEAA